MQTATDLTAAARALLVDRAVAGGDLLAALPLLLPAWASRRPAVAVSGGADSMCLALLARRTADPLALIVDHGLRPGSAAEAALTQSRLAAMGVPARILVLQGVRPGPGLAARARAARYRALCHEARADGRTDLWLGHHRSDQAETLLMRRLAGSGPTGLAAMALVVEYLDVRLLRPLLATAPGALRDILRQRGVDWIEDPSNADLRATRPRLRADLSDPIGGGDAILGLAGEAAAYGTFRAARDGESARELARRATLFPEGFALLTHGPISPGALGALIRGLSGAPYAPGGEALERLASEPRPSVLGGIRLLDAGRLGPGLLLVREPAALAPPQPAVAGAIWDRRFRVTAAAEGEIGALGNGAAAVRRYTRLPAVVLQTLPARRTHGVLVEVPHIGYRPACGSARMAVSFAPANPVAGAPFGA